MANFSHLVNSQWSALALPRAFSLERYSKSVLERVAHFFWTAANEIRAAICRFHRKYSWKKQSRPFPGHFRRRWLIREAFPSPKCSYQLILPSLPSFVGFYQEDNVAMFVRQSRQSNGKFGFSYRFTGFLPSFRGLVMDNSSFLFCNLRENGGTKWRKIIRCRTLFDRPRERARTRTKQETKGRRDNKKKEIRRWENGERKVGWKRLTTPTDLVGIGFSRRTEVWFLRRGGADRSTAVRGRDCTRRRSRRRLLYDAAAAASKGSPRRWRRRRRRQRRRRAAEEPPFLWFLFSLSLSLSLSLGRISCTPTDFSRNQVPTEKN